ncbi:MAG: glycosyltransferase family 4 protein [Planctomycetota bacterium]
MKWLFYRPTFDWPPRSGGTVHTGNLMRSLVSRGERVLFVTRDPIDPEAADWLTGVEHRLLPSEGSTKWKLKGLKKKFARYYGLGPEALSAMGQLLDSEAVDCFVAVGIETLPYLAVATHGKRIWYPADDPVLHHVSVMKRGGPSWARLRMSAVSGLYERTFNQQTDVAWVVSQRDRNWMRRIGGFRRVEVIPNGVDTEHFQTVEVKPIANSCIFWGRLDFQPNVDAIEYFTREIWPLVRKRVPDAQFIVCGVHPTDTLRQLLGSTEGMTFHENPDDLRPIISGAGLAVFPMVSGAGVKNKVLEAAAMARPIIATPACLNGLHDDPPPPFQLVNQAKEWSTAMVQAWRDFPSAKNAGDSARAWVSQHHSWGKSADVACQSCSDNSS